MGTAIGRFVLALTLVSVLAGMTVAELSSTSICRRWSHQGALVDSKLYIYGGKSKSWVNASESIWDNYFISLNLTQNFNVTAPPVVKLSLGDLPFDRPPSASTGALWPSSDGKYLYRFAGELLDPQRTPNSNQLIWRYDIEAQEWDPIATVGDQVVQPTQGSSCSVPFHGTDGEGLGIYVGRHVERRVIPLDNDTYDASMLVFDIGAQSFKNYSSNASYTENTTISLPTANSLVYVPGLGSNQSGVIVSLGGITDGSLASMATLDIFDLTTQTWSKQNTSGTLPSRRLNSCAIVAMSSNSTQNIYMYGGQSPLSLDQFSDMWILTLPSFTWVQVNETGIHKPHGRSMHTCHAIGSQMVVVGGYQGEDHSDGSGLHVFDMTSLQWKMAFEADTVYTLPIALGSVTSQGTEPAQGTQGTDPSSSTDPPVSSTTRPSPSSSASFQPKHSNPTPSGSSTSLPPSSASIITLHGAATSTTTFNNGQVSQITTTIRTTLTITPSSKPSASSANSANSSQSTTSQPLSTAKIAGIVGGVLGAVIVFLALGWLFYALSRNRKPKDWERATTGDRSPEMGGVIASGGSEWQSSDEALHRGSNGGWDVSEWDGDVLLSPRQSLRVINE